MIALLFVLVIAAWLLRPIETEQYANPKLSKLRDELQKASKGLYDVSKNLDKMSEKELKKLVDILRAMKRA
jgi:6-phosphogluconate dehydrogenase (decarboxylating)